MRTRLYAEELLKKLVKENELRILERIWDSELSTEQKIALLMEGDRNVRIQNKLPRKRLS